MNRPVGTLIWEDFLGFSPLSLSLHGNEKFLASLAASISCSTCFGGHFFPSLHEKKKSVRSCLGGSLPPLSKGKKGRRVMNAADHLSKTGQNGWVVVLSRAEDFSTLEKMRMLYFSVRKQSDLNVKATIERLIRT